MNMRHPAGSAETDIADSHAALGPYVVAAEATRMPLVFTDATDANEPIVFANDSFLKLFGYAREDVIGQSFAFLMPETADPAVLELVRNQFDGDTEDLDVEFARKDGGRLTAALLVNPVRDADERLVRHCVSFVDLSAHLKRLRIERDALHVIYEHTPDFIAITEGPEHRFTFTNAAYYKLVGQRDLLGLPVAEAFPELAGDTIFEALDTVYRTGEALLASAAPFRLQREPGADVELRLIDFICQPVRGSGGGSITGMFWEGHDVTEHDSAAKQVQSLQADLIHLSRASAMGTMGATLAHELTQPLTAISNYAAVCSQLNQAGGDNSATIAESLTAIAQCARLGGEIIHRVRNMAMRRKPRREVFSLREAIRESVVLVRVGACAGVSIEDRSSGTAMLEADRVQIQQVIMNLVRNACEAAAAGPAGRVRVTTALKGDKVVVSVRDSGCGVSAEMRETLFTWTQSTKPKGMGIGLSICRTIIEAHGGELWLEDDAGKGTCFAFSLPVHVEAAKAGVRGVR